MVHRSILPDFIRCLALSACVFHASSLVSQEFFFPYTVNHFQNESYARNKLRSVCEVAVTDTTSDTTSIRYYDRDGWLLSEDQFMFIDPYGTRSHRSWKLNYVRDTNTLVRETYCAYEKRKVDSVFRLHTKCIKLYVFSSQGLLQTEYQFTPNEDTVAVTIYEYDEKGRCSGYTKRSGKQTFRYSFIYEGNCVHFIDSTFLNNNRSCCFNDRHQILLDSSENERIRYTYDDKNRLVRQVKTVAEPIAPFEDRTIIFSYDGDYALPMQSQTIFEDYELEFSERYFGPGLTEYFYSDDGLILESKTGNYRREYSYSFHLN